MRRTHHLPHGLEAAYAPSHQVARCTSCHSILTDESVTVDGVRIGRVRMVCPHCAWGWPLMPSARVRQEQAAHPMAKAADLPDLNLKGRSFAEQSALARRGWETRRMQQAAKRTRGPSMQPDAMLAAIGAFYRAHERPPTFAELGEGSLSRDRSLPHRGSLEAAFGSVRVALLRAGIPEKDLRGPGYRSHRKGAA